MMKQLQKKLSRTDFKTKYIILTIFLLILVNAFSQEKPANNDVYVEIGGNGLYYSINYERILLRTGFTYFALRGGISVGYVF